MSKRPRSFWYSSHSAWPWRRARADEPFHLVAPFETDARRWRSLDCFNLYTGERFRIRTGDTALAVGNVCVVQSYRDVLEGYRRRPELKLAAPDGSPCAPDTRGMLRGREVTVIGITHIGKETNDLDDQELGIVGEFDEVTADLGDPETDITDLVRTVLRHEPRAELMAIAACDRRTVERFLLDDARPHPRTLAKLQRRAVQRARINLRPWSGDAPSSDFDVLLAYCATAASRRQRRCSCGKWVTTRARWCSDACRKRAQRVSP